MPLLPDLVPTGPCPYRTLSRKRVSSSLGRAPTARVKCGAINACCACRPTWAAGSGAGGQAARARRAALGSSSRGTCPRSWHCCWWVAAASPPPFSPLFSLDWVAFRPARPSHQLQHAVGSRGPGSSCNFSCWQWAFGGHAIGRPLCCSRIAPWLTVLQLCRGQLCLPSRSFRMPHSCGGLLGSGGGGGGGEMGAQYTAGPLAQQLRTPSPDPGCPMQASCRRSEALL
jgi:hypothetical protein